MIVSAPYELRTLVSSAAIVAALAACGGQSLILSPPGPAPKQTQVERFCPEAPTNVTATCFGLLRTDVGSRSPGGYRGERLETATAAFRQLTRMRPDGPIFAPYYASVLQQAYNLPSTTAGHGQTVAIIDAYDSSSVFADVATYRKYSKLPACGAANNCLRRVNEDGNSSPLPVATYGGWAAEITLDVEMVSAICPNCSILLVEARSADYADLRRAENTAVRLGAKYISNSWGANSTVASDPVFDGHAGVVITASTGDSGFGLGAQQPAAFQNVVAVGGTSLYPAGGPRNFAEVAWSGTGSWCGTVVPRPSWQSQQGCLQATGFDGRTASDISAVADPQTGVWIYGKAFGGWSVAGGTSAASPIIAAAYALAGNAATVGRGASSIWQAGTGQTGALNDVTLGASGLGCLPAIICVSQPGYDGPTGWGTPNGVGAL